VKERDRKNESEAATLRQRKDINLQNEFLFLFQGNLICRIKAKHILYKSGRKIVQTA